QRCLQRLVCTGGRRYVPVDARALGPRRCRSAGRARLCADSLSTGAVRPPAGPDERVDADRSAGAAPLLCQRIAPLAAGVRRGVPADGTVERVLPVFLPAPDRRGGRRGAAAAAAG